MDKGPGLCPVDPDAPGLSQTISNDPRSCFGFASEPFARTLNPPHSCFGPWASLHGPTNKSELGLDQRARDIQDPDLSSLHRLQIFDNGWKHLYPRMPLGTDLWI